MSKLELNHIYKKYDGNENYSVTDFNLKIEDKEFIVFVGPSGCGKSTTLRMIAGLEDITEGELIIDGQVMNDTQPKDRNIAMVFQNYALYPHMTVFDNMAFGLKLMKKPKDYIKQKVNEASDILGLGEYLNRKPNALSGGQRQRVALGRAIVRDANLFLMDEPLSNLDAKLRVQMRAEIAKLHKSLGTTTIYVTHDQTEAMTMASRIVIMKDGFIQQIGTPKEVYNDPANIFVAGFIGSPAANILKLKYENGYVFDSNDLVLKVSEIHEDMLNRHGYQGKEIIMSIRPEDIEVCSGNHIEGRSLDTKITVSELLGSETILYISTKNKEMIAKVGAKDYHEAGTDLTVNLNMDNVHFYDCVTEERIRS